MLPMNEIPSAHLSSSQRPSIILLEMLTYLRTGVPTACGEVLGKIKDMAKRRYSYAYGSISL
jgi:hypothetical protein